MSSLPFPLPTSKLFEEYFVEKRKPKKLKKECCMKYTKKKGKYCKGCPTLYALCHNAGRNI